ncbi:hypothetical protein PVA38_11225 [Streptococcus pneumoniae D39]|nr:hypothetical protein PVA38_11225 [Streptococcus pneumoniae D39]
MYKRQPLALPPKPLPDGLNGSGFSRAISTSGRLSGSWTVRLKIYTVSYTHLRAHETVLDLVCRLLLEKKKK